MNEFIEYLYPDQDIFSENLYNHGLYGTMFGLAAFIALLVTVIFYYIVNSPRFNKRIHWFMMLGIVGVINFIIALQYPSNVLYRTDSINCDFNDLLIYGAVHAFWSIFLFVVFSIALKWWSRNCKTTPF